MSPQERVPRSAEVFSGTRSGGSSTEGLEAASSSAAPTPLLEREQSIATLTDLIHSALDGKGSLAVIVGKPGEGKTTLLQAAGALGLQAGMQLLHAHGSDLERSFALGVVRQLLEPAVLALDPDERAELFTGAARLAASMLDLDLQDSPPPLDAFVARHGLYWLLAGLASRHPLILLIDDAHWADDPSLQWLASLVRRLDGLRALVLVATRSPALDGSGDALANVFAEPAVPLLHVAPLGRDSIAALARLELSTTAEDDFIAACHRATGGNPLAVIELLRDIHRQSRGSETSIPKQLGDRAPEAIERHIRGRLEQLGPAAVTAAQALAVLGDRAQLHQVASLAGIQVEQAASLIDQLALAGILSRTVDLRFEHPLVHAAIRDSISPRMRARLHAHAAVLLAAEHHDPEAIAAHLLLSDPAGESQTVDGLRAAATAALRRGSPDSAATYLRRALEEPPPSRLRSALTAELGHVEWIAADTRAIEHLQAARELATDPRERAQLGYELSEAYFYAGERDQMLQALATALDDIADRDPEFSLGLQAMGMTARASLDTGWPAAQDPEYERLAQRAGSTSQTGRCLHLCLAWVKIMSGRSNPQKQIEHIQASLDVDLLQSTEPGRLTPAAQALFALVFTDRLEQAMRLTEVMLAHASEQGAMLGFGLGHHIRSLAELRRGALAEAEASARSMFELASERQLRFVLPLTLATLGEVLLERGSLQEATEVLTSLPPDGPALTISYFLRMALARLHRARGDFAAAISELHILGETATRNDMHNPSFLPWRSELALLITTQAPERGLELAESELQDARRLALPRAIGVALRARAACESGAAREASLREALQELEHSPAVLELARTLIDLGGHLRRSGRRTSARQPLRQALDIAYRCAAQPLIALASEELRAADGRPRSPWLSGVASLTPSELRVARLAAAGHSNQQTAQTLFITIKTVEMHLTNAYRKLGIDSREKLRGALELEGSPLAD